MMTKERLREIKRLWTSYAPEDVRERNNGRGYVHVLELVAEVERLRAEVERLDKFHDAALGYFLAPRSQDLPTCTIDRRPQVPHVGPPDTTPCVQVPVADARDGGL
jgi:hypothetical protein